MSTPVLRGGPIGYRTAEEGVGPLMERDRSPVTVVTETVVPPDTLLVSAREFLGAFCMALGLFMTRSAFTKIYRQNQTESGTALYHFIFPLATGLVAAGALGAFQIRYSKERLVAGRKIAAHIGTYFSPFTSLVMMRDAAYSAPLMFLVVVAQFLAWFLAALVTRTSFAGGFVNDATPRLALGYLQADGLFIETIGTFLISVAAFTQSRHENAHASITYALLISSIFATHATGAAFNPYYVLAGRVVSNIWSIPAWGPSDWIYLVGPLIGSVLAYFFYYKLYREYLFKYNKFL